MQSLGVCVQTVLIVVGLGLEVVGLSLVSAEDLAPLVIGARTRLERQRFVETVRRRLGKSAQPKAQVTISDVAAMRDRRRVFPELSPHADPERKVEYLIEQAWQAHQRLNEIDQRLEAEHTRRTNALNELRREIDAAIGEGVETSRLRYIKLRRVGLVFLVLGSACLAIANLI